MRRMQRGCRGFLGRRRVCLHNLAHLIDTIPLALNMNGRDLCDRNRRGAGGLRGCVAALALWHKRRSLRTKAAFLLTGAQL